MKIYITPEEQLVKNTLFLVGEYYKKIHRERIKRGLRLKKLIGQAKNNQSVIYLRSATVQQGENNSSSLEIQKKACLEFSKRNNFKVSKIFSDNGVSGIEKNKPAFKKSLRYCQKNKVKNIIVADMDRLSRDYLQYNQMLNILSKKGIKIYFVNN